MSNHFGVEYAQALDLVRADGVAITQTLLLQLGQQIASSMNQHYLKCFEEDWIPVVHFNPAKNQKVEWGEVTLDISFVLKSSYHRN